MKKYIVIVKTTGGRIGKFQDFNTEAEADNHALTYGGFVTLTPSTGNVNYWVVNEVDKTLTYDSVAQVAANVAESAKYEIHKLESQETPRRLSEALPDDAGGNADGRAWLKANRDKIITERDKL